MKFKDYYAYYLTLHQNKWCRRFHILGNIATLVYVGAVVYSGAWWFLLLSPFIVYPFAWSGHFLFEENTPAAWSNPFKAKACDWKMMWDMIRGKMEW
tara:strand:- start:2659 stop:2949 length:291 start_codon:yes stop_codon:yes gene_type:complete